MRVIAVAGCVGAGKTSLVLALKEQLGHVQALHIDDYQSYTEQSISQLRDWMERGGSYGELQVPLLEQHVLQLCAGSSVLHPVTGETLEPQAYLILETPFGRAHPAFAPFIDDVVWLDTPMDVALARKILEMNESFDGTTGLSAAVGHIDWISQYLGHYLSLVRDLTLIQETRVRPHAEWIISGLLSPGEQAAELVRKLRNVEANQRPAEGRTPQRGGRES